MFNGQEGLNLIFNQFFPLNQVFPQSQYSGGPIHRFHLQHVFPQFQYFGGLIHRFHL